MRLAHFTVKVLTEKLTPNLPDELEYPVLHQVMKSCFAYDAEKRNSFKWICSQLGENEIETQDFHVSSASETPKYNVFSE